MRTILILLAAAATGVGLAYVDSRPTFDDTGVLAAGIFAASGLFGALLPRLAWLVALAVGGWIPLHNAVVNQNYASLLALAFAFAGAYAGMTCRRLIVNPRPVPPSEAHSN